MGHQLPTYFSLKSKCNNKYLRYTNNGGEIPNGLLKYSDTILVSPFTKFSVQPCATEEGLVHIKSCYNNKFWVRLSENSKYIAAIADEKQDDKSVWSCTLFKPIFKSEQNAYCFLHVQLNLFLSISKSNPPPYTDSLAASVEDLTKVVDDNLVLSIAVVWDSIFILPKYSAFKSNNGAFLKPLDEFLQYSAPNVEDIAVTFEITFVEDAYIFVKHFNSNKNWIRRSNNWVESESIEVENDDYNPNSLFWPVRIDNKLVVLRNKANDNFCKRYTTRGKYINFLSAVTQNLNDSTARIEVKDVAISKKIKDLEYKINDARIYGNKILTLCEGIVINNTKVESKLIIAFKCQKKAERIWSSTVSKVIGVTTNFAATVPIFGKDGFSFQISDENKWDENKIENSFEDVQQTVVVAPMSKVKYIAKITQASYDVPFSYNRLDTLQVGREVTNHYEDGLFTGFITFDYKFETENLPYDI